MLGGGSGGATAVGGITGVGFTSSTGSGPVGGCTGDGGRTGATVTVPTGRGSRRGSD